MMGETRDEREVGGDTIKLSRDEYRDMETLGYDDRGCDPSLSPATVHYSGVGGH